ncbi:MAG: nucleotidyltransferase family protein, partial [Desulfobacterales bacterium]|nr:nucleotidyltransferase family protein [Desulfobacterales bacterium]
MKQMKLSSENGFVISTLRYFLKRETSFQADDNVLKSMDWDKIIVFAKYQNILTIIYHVLSKQDLLNKIPSEYAIEMEKDYFGKAAFSMNYEVILKEITDILYREKIPFIVIKGPTIAFELYEPRETRPYQDLDILIKRRDYERVKEILAGHQFNVTNPDTEARRRKYLNSVEFSVAGFENISIDLHWDTLMASWGKAYFSTQKVWENIRWLELSEMRIPTLNPMILIPYLCLHLAFHHQFGKLQTLCDLDLAVKKFNKDIAWDEMLEQSYRMKMSKAVIYSMKLSETILKTEFPPIVSKILKKKTIEEKLFPFSYFIFREKPVSEMIGRSARFFLIDDFRGKVQALS